MFTTGDWITLGGIFFGSTATGAGIIRAELDKKVSKETCGVCHEATNQRLDALEAKMDDQTQLLHEIKGMLKGAAQ